MTIEDKQRQPVLEQPLDGPLQRPSAVNRVPAPLCQQPLGGLGDTELDVALGEALLEAR